jgi:hypothetical protein
MKKLILFSIIMLFSISIVHATGFGNASDGNYTCTGTCYLDVNRVYNFDNFNITTGATLTTSSPNGSVLYILVKNNAEIHGTIDVSNVAQPGMFTDTFTYNGESYSAPSVKYGGCGLAYNTLSSCGTTANSANKGFGGGGKGALWSNGFGGATASGNGVAGGTPFGSAGGGPGASGSNAVNSYQNGNDATGYSAGGSGTIAYYLDASYGFTWSIGAGSGGGSYGAAGGNGAVQINRGGSWPAYSCNFVAGAGGGAGGLAGRTGYNFVIKAKTLNLSNGKIYTRGGNGGNGGNGGQSVSHHSPDCVGAGDGLTTGGGASGGAGGPGNAGSIKIYASYLVDSTGFLTNTSGGVAGEPGQVLYSGSWQDPTAGHAEATTGNSGTVTYYNLSTAMNISPFLSYTGDTLNCSFFINTSITSQIDVNLFWKRNGTTEKSVFYTNTAKNTWVTTTGSNSLVTSNSSLYTCEIDVSMGGYFVTSDTTTHAVIQYISPTPNNNASVNVNNGTVNVLPIGVYVKTLNGSTEIPYIVPNITINLYNGSYSNLSRNTSGTNVSVYYINYTDMVNGNYYYNITGYPLSLRRITFRLCNNVPDDQYVLIYSGTSLSASWNITDPTKNYCWYMTATDGRVNYTTTKTSFNITYMDWDIGYSSPITNFTIRPNASAGTFYPVGQTDAIGIFNLTNYETVPINVSVRMSKGLTRQIDVYFMSMYSGYCYQESCNVSNQMGTDGSCTLNYTGTISYNSSMLNTITPLTDGDWTQQWNTCTYGSPGWNTGDIFINYTKPVGVRVSNTSFWMIRESGYPGTVQNKNLTIPTSCMNASANKLMLKLNGDFGPVRAYYYCNNLTDWVLLSNDNPYFTLCEEAMIWDMDPTIGNLATGNLKNTALIKSVPADVPRTYRINTYNDSTTSKTVNFTSNYTDVAGYLYVPKYLNTSTNISFNVTGSYGSTYCYQESANTTNQSGTDTQNCSLVYTGTNTWNGDGSITIVYKKPVNSTPDTKWQVKHGYGGEVFTNVSLPLSCWNYSATNITLQIWGVFGLSATTSWASCYNGSWVVLSNATSPYATGYSLTSPDGYLYWIDGNWSSSSYWHSTVGEARYNGAGKPYFFEEGMYWGIAKYTNNTWIKIGNVSNSQIWNYSSATIFNSSQRVNVNATSDILSYLSTCTGDIYNMCNMPIYVYASNISRISVFNISVNMTSLPVSGTIADTPVAIVPPSTTMYLWTKAVYNYSILGATYNFIWTGAK